MTPALKAALLSGLLLPGAGQILLRRYRRGIFIIAGVLAGMTILVVAAARTAISMLEKLEMQGGVADPETLTRLAVESSSSTASTYAACLLWIAGLWVFSVIDAWRIGKGAAREGRP